MTKVAIAAASETENLKAAQVIHEMTGLSLSSAISRLKRGSLGIFYSAELFLNDHIEKDREIRTLVSRLQQLDVELFIAELPENLSWKEVGDVKNLHKYRVSAHELVDLLDRVRGSYE